MKTALSVTLLIMASTSALAIEVNGSWTPPQGAALMFVIRDGQMAVPGGLKGRVEVFRTMAKFHGTYADRSFVCEYNLEPVAPDVVFWNAKNRVSSGLSCPHGVFRRY